MPGVTPQGRVATKQPLRLPAKAMLDKFLRSLKMRNFKSQLFLSTKNLCIVFFMTADYACTFFLFLFLWDPRRRPCRYTTDAITRLFLCGPGGGNFFSCEKSERPPCASWHQSPQTDELRIVILLPFRHVWPVATMPLIVVPCMLARTLGRQDWYFVLRLVFHFFGVACRIVAMTSFSTSVESKIMCSSTCGFCNKSIMEVSNCINSKK